MPSNPVPHDKVDLPDRLMFGGWERGALIRGWELKIILLGGGVGAYSRLGAY